MIAKVEYLGFPNCVEISNGESKLIVSTDFGPRILFYALDAGENILGWHPEAEVKTALGTRRPPPLDSPGQTCRFPMRRIMRRLNIIANVSEVVL